MTNDSSQSIGLLFCSRLWESQTEGQKGWDILLSQFRKWHHAGEM